MAERDGVYHVTGDEVAEMLAEIRERAHPAPPMHPIRADLTRAVSLIAERVASVADRRATSAELAAMRLALGVLRWSAWRRGTVRDARANAGVQQALDALFLLTFRGPCSTQLRHLADSVYAAHRLIPGRLLRARLALYLRARLRMERGDLGPVHTCTACAPPRAIIPAAKCAFCRGRSRRITPLWQLAPAHEARS